MTTNRILLPRKVSTAAKKSAPAGIYRGKLAEEYDGIGQYTRVLMSSGSTSAAYKARVSAGAIGTGQKFAAGVPVVVFSNHGKLEILSLGAGSSGGTARNVGNDDYLARVLGGSPGYSGVYVNPGIIPWDTEIAYTEGGLAWINPDGFTIAGPGIITDVVVGANNSYILPPGIYDVRVRVFMSVADPAVSATGVILGFIIDPDTLSVIDLSLGGEDNIPLTAGGGAGGDLPFLGTGQGLIDFAEFITVVKEGSILVTIFVGITSDGSDIHLGTDIASKMQIKYVRTLDGVTVTGLS